MPLIPDNGTLIPTSSIWRVRISNHEILHAEGYQSLKEDYFNNLSRLFCSRNICREGIEFAISEFNKFYSIENYRQCIHYYHRGEPRTQLRSDGTLQYSSLNFYPINSTNAPNAFAICEALPEPHQ